MSLASWMLLTGGFVAGSIFAVGAIMLMLWLQARSMEAEYESEKLLAAARPPAPPKSQYSYPSPLEPFRAPATAY